MMMECNTSGPDDKSQVTRPGSEEAMDNMERKKNNFLRVGSYSVVMERSLEKDSSASQGQPECGTVK
jgi:hypothetical protein